VTELSASRERTPTMTAERIFEGMAASILEVNPALPHHRHG